MERMGTEGVCVAGVMRKRRASGSQFVVVLFEWCCFSPWLDKL